MLQGWIIFYRIFGNQANSIDLVSKYMMLNTIILDKTIIWDGLLFNVTNKVTKALCACQLLSGKTWKFMIKNYLLVWSLKTKPLKIRTLLHRLSEPICFSITVVMKSCPLELLNISPRTIKHFPSIFQVEIYL